MAAHAHGAKDAGKAMSAVVSAPERNWVAPSSAEAAPTLLVAEDMHRDMKAGSHAPRPRRPKPTLRASRNRESVKTAAHVARAPPATMTAMPKTPSWPVVMRGARRWPMTAPPTEARPVTPKIMPKSACPTP